MTPQEVPLCAACREHPATAQLGVMLPSGDGVVIALCAVCGPNLLGQPIDAVLLAVQVPDEVMVDRKNFADLILSNYQDREISMMQHPAFIAKMSRDTED